MVAGGEEERRGGANADEEDEEVVVDGTGRSGMASKAGSGRALGSGEFWKAPPAQRSCFCRGAEEAESTMSTESKSAALLRSLCGEDESGAIGGAGAGEKCATRVGLVRKCCGDMRSGSELRGDRARGGVDGDLSDDDKSDGLETPKLLVYEADGAAGLGATAVAGEIGRAHV